MESRARASGEQFSTLLEFMESHGDLAKPQPGAQGRLRAERLWQELAAVLNSVGGGVHKTPDKWRKVWADWKSKTKKKALSIRRHANGTGGGPSSHLTMTAFEERVLAIMGALAVEGHPGIEEQGLVRLTQSTVEPSTAPYIDLEIFPQNEQRPASPQPSTSQQQHSTATFPRSLSLRARPRLPPDQPASVTPPSPAPTSASSASRRRPATLPTPSTPPSATQRLSVLPAPLTAPSSGLRRPLQMPTSPPSASRRRSPTLMTPVSGANSPVRPHVRVRRRRAQTPFDRVTSEFVSLEQRRLQLEETRDRQLHERESRWIEVDHERNQLLRSLVEVAQAWLDHLRGSANTEPLPDND